MHVRELYLIGNGFDIFHGLESRYSQFCSWLESHHPTVFHDMNTIYGCSGTLWNDFENNLGQLNIPIYYKNTHIDPNENIWSEFIEHTGEMSPFVELKWTPAADRLELLYKNLYDCIAEWIDDVELRANISKKLSLPYECAYYINFNYTSILENVYNISSQNIWHVHGNRKNGDRLVFGHKESSLTAEWQYELISSEMPDDIDMHQLKIIFGSLEKNPYFYMSGHAFPDFCRVEKVYAYGLSFSDIDFYYITELHKMTPKAQWEITWYSDDDKKHIMETMNSVLMIPGPTYKLIQLKNIQKY